VLIIIIDFYIVAEYVEEIKEYPELIDMVVYPSEDDTNDKKFTYEEVILWIFYNFKID